MGNLTNEPALADFAHISAASPCRGAGSAVYTGGTDIDGEAWLNPPSIGCDEFYSGAATGGLAVSISASFTNCAAGRACMPILLMTVNSLVQVMSLVGMARYPNCSFAIFFKSL